MARISLRAYNREIENLIERGQIEEAIAHAKNILKQYPKHIETYRLLGKAYLESQRYSEASDILQRVLSVIPDDFVSQLGMSIIREDEGNLDAAIWHMERAYEVQPFNRAVQDELRRLYGRRDGVEPPRVRLTRGSLVRMYARGELYPQAIAETRAALAEDSQRLDLQVLLARMYHQSGLKVEAAEISSALIGKLPYCLEANKILMEILPSTSRSEEARSFQRRVYDLDPYAEFITPNAPTSAQVPEQSVTVEKVDWQPTMQDTQSPDWARTIGVKWEETKEEALPDWLHTIEPQSGEAPAPSPASAETKAEDIVPDFMRQAGWGQSDQTAAEPPSAPTFEESPAESALEQASMPDWLKSMAPPQPEPEAAQEDDRLNWLDTIIPAAGVAGAAAAASAATSPASEQETQPAVPTPSGEGSAAPADNVQTGPASEGAGEWAAETPAGPPGVSAEEELPDWLKELGSPEVQEAGSLAAPAETVPEELSPSDELPAWLQEPPPAETSEEKMAWVQETEAPEQSEPTQETPSWLRDEAFTASTGQAEPGWLESAPGVSDIPAIHEPGESPLATEPAQSGETGEALPDWLSELDSGEKEFEEPSNLASPGVEELPAVPVESAELPDWLSRLKTSPAEPEPGDQASGAPVEPGETAHEMTATLAGGEAAGEEEIPQWLQAISAEETAAPPMASVESPGEKEGGLPAVEEKLPDWLSETPTASEPEASKASEIPPTEVIVSTAPSVPTEEPDNVAPTQPVKVRPDAQEEASVAEAPAAAGATPTAPDLNDMDAAMAWLEALAAKQGAEPESLKITAPESRSEALPDWIAGLAEEPAPEAPQEKEASALAAEAPVEAGVGLPQEELPQAAVETHLVEQESVGTESEAPVFEEIHEPEAPAAAVETSMEAAAPAMPETAPAEPQEPAQTPAQTVPDLNDMDAALAWMESLAAKHGAEPESLKISQPEQRSETPPDWIAQISPESQEPAAAEPPSETAQVEIEEPLQPVPAEPPQMAAEPEVEPQIIETAPEPAAEPQIAAPESEAVAVPQMGAPAPEPAAEPEIPDWLLHYEEEQQKSTAADIVAPAAPVQVPSSEDTINDWLQRHHPEPGGEAQPVTEENPFASETAAPGRWSDQAESALSKGDVDEAASVYAQAVQDGTEIDAVIDQLRTALDRHPVDVGLWQTLGDAYIRADRVQEALDAYTKAEELLR